MFEITAFRLGGENISTMKTLEFITGHVVYNPAYDYILQMKETHYYLLQYIGETGDRFRKGNFPFYDMCLAI